MERQIKRSVALAIVRDDSVLLVQRPGDDEDLPNAWGLPAATLDADESWQDALRRAGRDKLGVEIEAGRMLNEGVLDRANYRLEMRVYEAVLKAGLPVVPQRNRSITQYQRWKWGKAEELKPAAEQGSLCCRLYLELEGNGYG